MRIQNIYFSLTLSIIVLMASSTLQSQEFLTKNAKIVFLGDSITQAGARPNGYVSIVRDQIKQQHSELNIEIIGAGISGNKVPDLQARLERDVLSKAPTTVVIYIGINDVWHSKNGRGTSKDDYEKGLDDIVSKIKGKGANVILCTPSVIGESRRNSLDKMLREYSNISRSVAEKHDLKLIDLRKAFRSHLAANNRLDRNKNILTTDGVHLNAAGNDFVAAEMLRGLGAEYQAKLADRVMRHIVLFQFKDSVPKEEVTKIVDAFGKLPEKIDTIIDYEAGTNVSPEKLDQGFTHAFVVTFRDAKARDAYLPHPAHKEFVKLLDGKIEQVLVFDFEN